jgi:hypothetical protein
MNNKQSSTPIRLLRHHKRWTTPAVRTSRQCRSSSGGRIQPGKDNFLGLDAHTRWITRRP